MTFEYACRNVEVHVQSTWVVGLTRINGMEGWVCHVGHRPASEITFLTYVRTFLRSVQVKIMPLVPGTATRDVKTCKITSAGAVLEGKMSPEIRNIAREYERAMGHNLPRIPIDDRRAQQLMVVCVGEDYYLVPAPELFSRHTGTCRVLGDKHQRTMDYHLEVGDFLRIGSVGLIVSELDPGQEREVGSQGIGGPGGRLTGLRGVEGGRGAGEAGAPSRQGLGPGSLPDGGNLPMMGEEDGRGTSSSGTAGRNRRSSRGSITEKDLFYLREDAGEIRQDLFAQEEAATAVQEGLAATALGLSPGRSPRVALCYMCFDDEDSSSNPLVAPCLCKGGTRYVHLSCLRTWQASAGDEKDCVLTSAEMKTTCKICKAKYKTHVRTGDGRLLPLLEHQLPPPFICFLVVTKHDAAEELFNTQFQLSFSENKQILIGRSRNCHMVLDYRTVSTQHATVTYRKGGFYFRDLSSSNGSMLNLRRPMKLPYNQWVRIRYGRSIVAFKARRSWMRGRLSSMTGAGAGVATLAREEEEVSEASREKRRSSSANPSGAMSVDGLIDEGMGERQTNDTVATQACEREQGTPSSHVLNAAHLQLLESLCSIEMTPRQQMLDREDSASSLPSCEQTAGRTSSLACTSGALGAAFLQMHLRGESSSGGLTQMGEGKKEGFGEEGGVQGDGGVGSARGRGEEAGSRGAVGSILNAPGPQGVRGRSVRFVPAESPIADSLASQLDA
jgi:hypothetical protein